MTTKIKHEGKVTSVSLPRALLRDARLSFGARGLFAYLWDLPDGWIIRLAHLAKMGPDGRDSLRSRLHELRSVGAIRIEAIREDEDGNTLPRGRVAGKRWVLVAADRWAIEAPLTPSPDWRVTENRVSQLSVEPIIGNPDAKGLQSNKDIQVAAKQHPSSQKKRRVLHGVICWTADDQAYLRQIVDQHGESAVSDAAARLHARGVDPLPGRVEHELQSQADAAVRANAQQTMRADLNRRHAVAIASDPQTTSAGLKILNKMRQKRIQSEQGGKP